MTEAPKFVCRAAAAILGRFGVFSNRPASVEQNLASPQTLDERSLNTPRPVMG